MELSLHPSGAAIARRHVGMKLTLDAPSGQLLLRDASATQNSVPPFASGSRMLLTLASYDLPAARNLAPRSL
jgi:hypothetical protein